jgi:hypothetical protein
MPDGFSFDQASVPQETPPPTPTGPLPVDVYDRANAVYSGLLDRGMKPATALGYAANAVVETGANPESERSSSGAAGTFQWVGPRLTVYRALHGHDPEDGDLDEHLDHVVWENQNIEQPAWEAVNRAPNNPVAKAIAVRTAWERPGTTPDEVVAEEDKAASAARSLLSMGIGSARAAEPPKTTAGGFSFEDAQKPLPKAAKGFSFEDAQQPPPDQGTARMAKHATATQEDVDSMPDRSSEMPGAPKAAPPGPTLPTPLVTSEYGPSAEPAPAAAAPPQAWKWGLPGHEAEPMTTGQQAAPDSTPSNAGEQAYQAAREAWQNKPETVLTPKAQEILDNIQREGGVEGFLAMAGSTAAEDLAYLGGALGAAQAGGQAFVYGASKPYLGEQGARDLTAYLGGEYVPHATGIPHVAPLTEAESAAMREARGYSEAPLTFAPKDTPEDLGRQERENREAWNAEMERAMAAQPQNQPLAIEGPGGTSQGASAAETTPPSEPPKVAPPQRRPITPEAVAAREAAEGPAATPPASPVVPTTPEPRSDIAAQITAMHDPDNPKDSVFVAAGNGDALPRKLPQGTLVAHADAGTFLTTDPGKLAAFNQGPVTDEKIAALLGYPQSKGDALTAGEPIVVQAANSEGDVVAQAAVSPDKVPEAKETMAAQTPPGGQVEIKEPLQAQQERAEKVGAEPQPIPPPTGPAEIPMSGAYVMVDPRDLKVDPETFQYKQSDEGGVTGALHGISRWEPALANPITAWQSEDGSLYVVNGHQRTDLALRAQDAGQPDVQMPARIYREADGYTPAYMRTLGAYQNMAEGSGTAIDAAKVLRGANSIPDDRRLPDLPPRGQIVQQAASLAKLSDQSFGMVENGLVPAAYAAHVGELISDPTEQLAALDMLSRGHAASSEQARLMVRDIRDSGFLRGSQTTLFGDEDFARSLVPERAKVLDNAMRTLRRIKGVFRAAVEGEQSLTEAGNQMSTAANNQAKGENERILDILQRDATTRGPISDALSASARELADGKPIAGVASRFLARTRDIVKRGAHEGVRSGDTVDREEPARQSSDLDAAAEYREELPGEGLFEKRPPLPPKSGPDLFGGNASPRTAPTREPTIRNDRRQQLIPGTEPSAIQAQAARDQAGPRGDQQPANEGLFGRRETPQPALISPRPAASAFLQPNTRDVISLVPAGGNPHVTSRQFVLKYGTQTGHEFLTAVKNATAEIVHAVTANAKSFVPLDPRKMHGQPLDSYTVHHNHPNGGSLSPGDISMSATPQISHVIAHTGDDIFIARMRGERHSPDWTIPRLARTQHELKADVTRASGNVEHLLRQALARNAISLEQAHLAHWDMVNRLLHAAGIIDYVSTRKIPDGVLPEWRRLLERSGYDHARIDGSAVAVLPDEAIAGLSSGRWAAPGGEGTARQAVAGYREERTEAAPWQGPAAPLVQRRLLAPRGPNYGLNLTRGSTGDVIREKTGIPRAVAEIKSIFAPTALKGAKPTEQLVRGHGAEQAQSFAQAVHKLDKVRDAVDRQSKAEQIEITDRMEHGDPQPTPELQAAATALREVLDKTTRDVQSLGRGYLENAIQDYMGHIYGNYREWAAGQQPPTQQEMDAQARAAAQAKRPLQGSKNFLKRRTFPTQKEAIDAGLIPITYNPIDLQLLKIREMQKFYHGTRLADRMKETGIARWIPAGAEHAAADQGLVKLDDRVFQPRLMGDANTAGFGRLEPGNYYAPEAAARIFNNYMSRGLAGQSIIYDTIRGAGNALNSLQLGLSGFHATFVTLDTMISRSALGLHQIAGGQVGKGLASIGLGVTPASVVQTVREGSKLRNAWLEPQNATPEWRTLAENLNRAGGRINMDQFYRNNASGTFFRHLSDLKHPQSVLWQAAQMFRDEPSYWRKAVMVPLHLVGRTLDTIMEPLMGHMVPRAKLGVFAGMARTWDQQHPNATEEQRSAAMIKVWDSVENRLGQLTYDNLYWHKLAKDIAFVTTRSVGWNLGTVREIGGAGVDTAKMVADAARLKAPEFTYRQAYTIMLPIITAIYGALITYLATGRGPQHDEHDLGGAVPLDYFFPPTGEENDSGIQERMNMPGYMKDVIAMAHSPLITLGNKTHPLFSTAIDLMKNRDYYGGIIYNPSTDNQAGAYFDYLANQALPFSFRAQMKLKADGATPQDQALSFWGFQPAPKSIVAPEKGEKYEYRQNMMGLRRRNRESGAMHFFTNGPQQDEAP